MRGAATLERRFRAAAASQGPEVGAALLSARFGVRLDGGTVPWCWPRLLALWEALATLPASAVERNPALRRIVCVQGVDGAYRGTATRSPLGPGTIELGALRPGTPSRAYPVPIDWFIAMVHHEVGHAVAARLGLYDTLYERVPHSPWLFQGDREAFLRRLFAGEDPRTLQLGRLYLAQPPGRRSLQRALHRLQAQQRRWGQSPAPASLLRLPAVRHLAHNSRHALPCYHRLRPLPDGTLAFYDSGYGRGFVLHAGRLAQTRVSAYQMRSPNEWFAELFALHYAPGLGHGGLLRRLAGPLRHIADWLDAHV